MIRSEVKIEVDFESLSLFIIIHYENKSWNFTEQNIPYVIVSKVDNWFIPLFWTEV